MGKLVVLKFIDGSFDEGFTVMLQISEEGFAPSVEATGKLPPLPEMPLYYSRWRENYWRLDSRYRIRAKKGQKPNVSLLEDCHNAATMLKARLNTWLLAEEFRGIRDRWLERLSPDEAIRIIVQTEDSQLRQLPWNLLDVLDRYPKAELALSALNTEAHPDSRSRPKATVNILSILGNSEGIDTTADQAFLAALPDAHVTPLIEPDRKHLTEQLWGQPWDILFFAGHSSSQSGREAGRIFLNKTDSLTISELKYALRKSVENGLKLAIFNSCDGLGLARELADLRIPQIVVMREPVPDLVAQEFLKYFLSAYAQGASLYLAIREARERLQGMEDRFPCASWLPLICQQPAITPPHWHDFLIAKRPASAPLPYKRTLIATVLSSLVATVLVGGVRSLGWLNQPEWAAYDQMMRLRPAEVTDPRLLVVSIDDEDLRLQRQGGTLGSASISDENLSKLLALLNRYQPRAIGLDVHRDMPTNEAQYPALAAQLKTNKNLITICKVGYDKANPYGIPGPPEVPLESFRVSFSDFVLDRDEVLRRHLLAMNTSSLDESRCHVPTAFSVELVFRYLAEVWDEPRSGFDANNNFKIRLAKDPTVLPSVGHGYGLIPPRSQPQPWQPYDIVLPRLAAQQGGYQGNQIDTNGSQLLLNYRATPNPEAVATHKPLRWFLAPEQPPSEQELRALIQGKIVLIGVTAWEKRDLFKTPYNQGQDDRLAGVYVHAHMVSQLLGALLDGRPLIWTWPAWGDWLWIGSWSFASGLLTWLLCLRQVAQKVLLPQIALSVGMAVGILYGVCTSVLVLAGGWLPCVPAALALMLTSTSVMILFMQQPAQAALSLVYSH